MSTCVSCNRKFATQSSSTYANLCRTCRSTGLTGSATSPNPTSKSSISLNTSKSLITSTPKFSKPGGAALGAGGKQGGSALGSGRNLVPMKCKVCNTCFRYRRCLFRHLRENHPQIDQDNLMQYIDMNATTATTTEQQDSSSGTPTADAKGVTSGGKEAMSLQGGGRQDVDASMCSSLHVTIGSEVGNLTESTAASLLGGEGDASGNENGGMAVHVHTV